MLIDWFTIGAQLLNFIVLVWLMKRFLYQPILNAIDAREQKVAKQIADAEQKMELAQEERDEYLEKKRSIETQRASLISRATDEAQALRHQLLEEARQEADALRQKKEDDLREDVRSLNAAIGRQTQAEVFAIARRALNDLASASLEERMAQLFVERVRQLEPSSRTELQQEFKSSSEPAVVHSAFELPSAARDEITNVLEESFGPELKVRFDLSPDLVGGIELVSNASKIRWSIAGYLSSLEQNLEELTTGAGRASRDPGFRPERP